MEQFVQAFALGVASAASPCLLPLYPGFIAYLAGNSRSIAGRRAAGLLGLLVLAGVLTVMLAIGLLLTVLAVPVGPVLAWLVPLIDLVLIALGVLLIAGRNPFERLPGARVPVIANPYGQAYVYGLMLGPLALPCAGAFVVALFAISIGVGDAIPRIARFLVYGLGFGLPLVALSLVAGARGQALVRWVVARHRAIELVAGVLLVAAGIWDLWMNWDNIRFTLGF